MFRPKFVTFDCYGTLTHFQMAELTREIFGPRLSEEALAQLIKNFAAYRVDEILGDWKPYDEVIANALERACKRNQIPFDPAEGRRFYDAVPTWGPHPDVPEGLAKVAREVPLVVLSNAMDSQIHANVDKLGAPFAHVFTAEQAQAYKPRLRAFEYMLDSLGCGPQDVLHVSSSFRYDLMSAYDMGITNKVWVDRGHEPANPYYGYTRVNDISELPAVLGL